MKKLVIFSKTIPDYTMGGNGNILYHLLKKIPKEFKEVSLILFLYKNRKIDEKFKKKFPNIKFKVQKYFIDSLKKKKNKL